ncbi:hypothetical protein K461DRAFT_268148 [Myriangium duriaei CBS 260.36]|uniref:Uncharacterized protein n=1 Tax=Myriangium duriaei CBS 260.36 TaxID=1168546 RepID=A0A9P4MKX3_9PEZI|nr:hypothetical protein K461DRAFT_268148 [Myriangium duriaei CBS 260.36]
MKAFLFLPLLLSRSINAAAIAPNTELLEPVDVPEDDATQFSDFGFNAKPKLEARTDVLDAHHYESHEEKDGNNVDVRPDASLGHLLGTFKSRLIYFTSAKSSKTSVKDVVQMLNEKGSVKASENDDSVQGFGRFITNALLTTLVVIVTLAVIFDDKSPPLGMQIINVGIDDGKSAKVKRHSILLDHPTDVVTWDLADDEAHSVGNVHDNRPVISDDLRDQMLASGHRNVTFLHHNSPNGKTPALFYRTEDGQTHYHWRPSESPSLVARKDQIFKGHYAYFDADGAGFKISAQNPITGEPPMSETDAKPIAQAITSDFLEKRSAATYVGYQEQLKRTKALGHKICIIAEPKRFGLQNEIDKCFGKSK